MANKSNDNLWAVPIIRSFWIVLTGAIALIIYIFILSQDLPSIDQLENFDPDLVTRIYSSDGEIIHELFVEKRVFVELDAIPKHMHDAILSSEDRRFRDHWGISLRSVARAIITNVLALSYRQGFSTLTQQLARNLYDTIGFKKTVTRKIKEMITAIQIEKTYTKDEILEMYLNSVHFGHGTYGVQAAAKRFYAKDVSDLNIDECALLVGLLPAPARYSPIRHPDKAFARRNTVLRLMREQKYISDAVYVEARSTDIDNIQKNQFRGVAPYFTEYVRRVLETEDERLGINIYRDGLKIFTTLDSRLQRYAEDAIMQSIVTNQNRLNKRLFKEKEEFENLAYLGIFNEDTIRLMMKGELPLYEDLRDKLLVQCAFVALDTKTGAILAMVGGRPDYIDQFNRVTQAKRQPGSVFKPFVYTTAIDNGVPVSKQLLNQPVVLKVPTPEGGWENWNPRNYDESTGGLTTIREGLRRSLNLVSVRMVQEVVPAREVALTAKNLGISTNIRAVDAIALGTSEVYPIEMVAAYSVFANKGVYSTPFGITKIEDRYGNTLIEYYPKQEEILSEETAFMVTNLMQTVVDRGTGGSARWKYNFYHPAAGKTGTTQGWTDAWFVGFSSQIAAGAWFGVDDPQVSLGRGADGTRAALPSWARFMKTAHDSLYYPKEEFEQPSKVITFSICQVSKEKPTALCPIEKELFIVGTNPSRLCKIHRR